MKFNCEESKIYLNDNNSYDNNIAFLEFDINIIAVFFLWRFMEMFFFISSRGEDKKPEFPGPLR